MTEPAEVSREAEAAGMAAALAVEHAKEDQETREIAADATIAAGTAEIQSEIAAENANEALANAETAGSIAIVAGSVAEQANETAISAGQSAEEAKSEIQVLREELLGELKSLANLLNPPVTGDEVKEVTPNDGSASVSGGDGTGMDTGTSGGAGTSKANSNSGGKENGNSNSSSTEKGAGATKKRGFNKAHRR